MSGQPRMNPDLASDSREVQLSVRGLSKAFHGRPAIEDIDFTASRHEFVAVLGPSGAGKTTLFRCITGLLAADQGTVRIGRSEVTSVMTRRLRDVAVIFQQFNLVSRLTALENVLAGRLGYVPAWRGWLRRFDRSDRLLALECLDRVGLMDLAMRRADTLSGGQQQRVAIARALAQCPTLIVADEPVASLDPSTSTGVLDLLHGIARAPLRAAARPPGRRTTRPDAGFCAGEALWQCLAGALDRTSYMRAKHFGSGSFGKLLKFLKFLKFFDNVM
jgi:phosphonate transport system ATP-binding protein